MNTLNILFEMEYLHIIKVTTHNLLICFKQENNKFTMKILENTTSNVCLYLVLTFPLSFLSWIYWTHLTLHCSSETVVIKVNMTSTMSNQLVNSQSSLLPSQELITQMTTHSFLKSFFKTWRPYRHTVLVLLSHWLLFLILFCRMLSSSQLALNVVVSQSSFLKPLFF